MPKTTYASKRFSDEHLRVIDQATQICQQYAADGLTLTLRQLYYQFVARDLIPNEQKSYKRLSEILVDARMCGKFDWSYLIDRTRNIKAQAHQKSPAHLVRQAAEGFGLDMWAKQPWRIEVWIEKDAAIGVIEGVCEANDVPYFSCRGYTSVSEMWVAGNRLRFHIEDGHRVMILHIGDHDPSGLDMTRDIEERLRTFIHKDWAAMHLGSGSWTRGQIKASMRGHIRSKGFEIGEYDEPWMLKRIALNPDQIEQYAPPPNFAKSTDARYQRYVEETGFTDSWELDALEPYVLQDLIQTNIDDVRDDEIWGETQDEMSKGRAVLRAVSENWQAIADYYGPKEA